VENGLSDEGVQRGGQKNWQGRVRTYLSAESGEDRDGLGGGAMKRFVMKIWSWPAGGR
jgi:hypothetical protein